MQKKYVMQGTHKTMRGFEYLVYSAFSLFVILALTLLPLAPVFADEVADTEARTEDSTEESEVAESSESSEDPAQNEIADVVEGEPETSSSAESPQANPTDSTLSSGQSDQGDAESVVEEGESDPIPSDENDNESLEDEATDVPVDNTEEEIEYEENVSTTTEEEILNEDETVVDEDIEEELSTEELTEEDTTTTTEKIKAEEDTVVTVETPATNDSIFAFSREKCASVGDGLFYCSEATSTPGIVGVDRVFSAVDSEGDKEIYVEKDEELYTITENQYDDDAPYFDELSNTIVWHRLIEGRYQIVSYNIEEKEETILTADRFNNMEPSRYGGVTVWQAWIGNDWEVMLSRDGKEEMLTDNTTNDVAPRINGAYIVWQAFEENAWRVKVYDETTKNIETIDSSEGSSIENPRFVLVYDTKHENGDVETRGYDLEKKEVVPLSSTPVPVPEDLPDPDQTGEDRALVQTPVQVKQKTEGDEGDENDGGDDTLLSDEGDDALDTIIIPPYSTSTTDILDDEVGTTPDTSVEHIEDVVIPGGDTHEEDLQESPHEHIEDVIITPFVEPIEMEEGGELEEETI